MPVDVAWALTCCTSWGLNPATSIARVMARAASQPCSDGNRQPVRIDRGRTGIGPHPAAQGGCELFTERHSSTFHPFEKCSGVYFQSAADSDGEVVLCQELCIEMADSALACEQRRPCVVESAGKRRRGGHRGDHDLSGLENSTCSGHWSSLAGRGVGIHVRGCSLSLVHWRGESLYRSRPRPNNVAGVSESIRWQSIPHCVTAGRENREGNYACCRNPCHVGADADEARYRHCEPRCVERQSGSTVSGIGWRSFGQIHDRSYSDFEYIECGTAGADSNCSCKRSGRRRHCEGGEACRDEQCTG